jgi:hypothetical protein
LVGNAVGFLLALALGFTNFEAGLVAAFVSTARTATGAYGLAVQPCQVR